MQEVLATRQRRNSLAGWTISVTAAFLVFYGTSIFLDSHQQAGSRPAAGAITHSTPVGGVVQDGVFRSSPPASSDPDISRWRI